MLGFPMHEVTTSAVQYILQDCNSRRWLLILLTGPQASVFLLLIRERTSEICWQWGASAVLPSPASSGSLDTWFLHVNKYLIFQAWPNRQEHLTVVVKQNAFQRKYQKAQKEAVQINAYLSPFKTFYFYFFIF